MRICTTHFKECTQFYRYLAKKEAKRLEKEAKLAAKAAKVVATTATTPAGEKKAKEKVAKDQVVPFVNTTPKGHKKGEFMALERSVVILYMAHIALGHGNGNCFPPPSAMLIRCLSRSVRDHGRRLRSDCRRSRLV